MSEIKPETECIINCRFLVSVGCLWGLILLILRVVVEENTNELRQCVECWKCIIKDCDLKEKAIASCVTLLIYLFFAFGDWKCS